MAKTTSTPAPAGDLTLHHTVVNLLATEGIEASIEYPGALVIRISDSLDVWTGLNGWDYGTLNELDADGIMQPVDAPAEVDIDEHETDASVIAREWAALTVKLRSIGLVKWDDETQR